MDKEKKSINYQFKALYLIGIVAVLFCHVFTDGGIPGIIYILPLEGFNLAIFIFASGYLFKDEYSQTPFRYVLKKFATLIVPYFVLNVIYGGVAQLMHGWGFAFGGEFNLHNIFVQPIIDGHQFIYNLGGWFVFPLFGVMVVNVFLQRLLIKLKCKDYVIFSLFLVVGIIGCALPTRAEKTQWMLVLMRWMYFFPFFGFGFLYKNRLEKHLDKIPFYIYFPVLIVVRVAIMAMYGWRTPVYRIAFMNTFTACPFMPMLVGVSAILIFLRIAKYMAPLMERSKLLLEISNSTYSIMVNHLIVFIGVKAVFSLIFSDFSVTSFQTSIWYYYPENVGLVSVVYVLFGLLVPTGLSVVYRRLKTKLINARNKTAE